MKIGVIAYRQFPYVSANTAIAYIIGEQISKKHEVIFIGRKQDKDQEDITEYKGNKIVFLNKKPVSDSSRFRNKLVRIGLIRWAFFKDANELRKIVKNEAIDALISVIAPNEDIFISISARLKIPIYLYQLDPFYNLYDIENIRMKRMFLLYIKKVRYLFTTELLMDQYKNDPEFVPYMDKISVVQFPKLIRRDNRKEEEHDKTVLLFSGSLLGNRKPEHLIDLNKCLPNSCEIVLCGSCEREEDKKKLFDNGIIYKGYCSQDVLSREMSRADVFINIGNRERNQLPSKVIDYIATGKPIINLFHIQECSSAKVLREYKYCLNVNVEKIVQNRSAIHDFILRYKDERISWDEICEQYKEYTPEFVTERMLQQIDEMVNKA